MREHALDSRRIEQIRVVFKQQRQRVIGFGHEQRQSKLGCAGLDGNAFGTQFGEGHFAAATMMEYKHYLEDR